MNSLNDEDFTLPINFDESANPDQLPEVSQGTLLEFPDGSIPLVQKVATGRLSPIRARTMKEYDQQLADLKKENFNLKLRIYFLEERMEQRIGQDDEDLFKTNIELKVEVEGLKKELMDKQELLKKASRALDSISGQHQTELAKARENSQESVTVSLKEAEEKIKDLEGRLQDKHKELRDKEEEVKNFEQRIQDFMFPSDGSVNGEKSKAFDSDTEDDHSSRERDLEMAKKQILENQELIGQLRQSLKTKDLIIEQSEEEKKDLSKVASDIAINRRHSLQRQGIDQSCQTLPGPHDSVDSGEGGDTLSNLAEYKKKVEGLEKKLRNAQEGIVNKDEIIAKLEENVSKVDKSKEELLEELQSLREQLGDASQNVRQRDKIIKEFADRAVKMQHEEEDLQDQLKCKDDDITQLRDKMHKLNMDRHQGSEDRLSMVSEYQDRVSDMEDQLRQMQRENEKLQKTIGRQEAEISRKREELKRADSVLRQREENLQDLRDTLRDEKHRNSEKNDTVTKHYQALLDDAQRQIASQEKMLQRMSQSLRDKDKELHLALSQPSAESNEKLVSALKEQLKEKDKAIENAAEENFKMQETKDNDVRQLKLKLRERERDIDRANQMLLTAEETIDSLEAEGKERDAERRKLMSTVKSQQKAIQDEAEKHETALEEKEAMLQRLRAAMSRDSAVQNAESDNLVGQLQQRLKDKENLLEEVMTDHAKAQEMADKSKKELLNRLKEKDAEIRDMQDKSNTEVGELSRKVQALQANLNQKEYDLQTLETNSDRNQEHQKELIEKMQAAMNERDKTIMALVESARERDRLRELQQRSLPIAESSASAKLDIPSLKDDIAHLSNELNKKDELIERLKAALEASPAATPRPTRKNSNAEDLEREFAKRTENDVNKKLAEFGIKDVQDLQRIQDELQGFKEKSSNDPSSSKLQRTLQSQIKEAKTLNKSLEAERNIYVNLRHSDGATSGEKDSFTSELAAVETLRKQLKDGVKRNSHLGRQLEKQLKKTTAKQDSGTTNDSKDFSDIEKQLRDEIGFLRQQLDESQKPSLGATGGVASPTQDAQVATDETRKTVPSFNNTSDHSGVQWDSFIPSFRELPSIKELLPKEDDLSNMTSEQLRDVIHKLGSAIEVSQQQNEKLLGHTASRDLSPTREDNNSSPGAASAQMADGGATLRQMEQLQHELTRSERDKAKLRRQLDSLIESPESGNENRIIPVLREQLAEAKEALKSMKDSLEQRKLESTVANQSVVDSQYKIQDLNSQLQDLRAQLTHSENIKNILKRQLDLNVEVSQEQSNSESAGAASADANDHQGSAEGRTDAPSGDSKQKSNIPLPVRRKSSLPGSSDAGSTPDMQAVLQKAVDSLRKELHEERLHRKLLQGKLASTEQSVLSQKEKAKHYHKLLEDAGLIVGSRHKSSSESNLLSIGSLHDPEGLLTASASADDLLRDSSPPVETFPLDATPPTYSTDQEFMESCDDPVLLRDQVNRLKSQLQKSNRIIKGLRHKQKANKGGSPGTHRPPRPPGDRLSIDSANLEVVSLRQQLEAVRKDSEDLQRKLENENGHDTSGNWENLQEIENLQSKLSESERQVGLLEGHLEEVLQTVEEMLCLGEDGRVAEIAVTPDRVIDLRDKLNATLKLSSRLASNLQGQAEGPTEVRESLLESGVSAQLNNLGEDEASTHKKKILALQHEKSDLIRQLSAYQEKLLQAEATNNLLSQRYTSLERELQEMQQRSHDQQSHDHGRPDNNQSQDSGSFLDLSDKGQNDADGSSKLKSDASDSRLEGQISQMQMENAILAKEIVKTRVERDTSQKQNELLTSQLEDCQGQLSQLAEKLENMSAQLREAENKCVKVEKDRKVDLEKLKTAEKEKRKIEKSLKEQIESYNSLRKKLKEEQAAAVTMKTEIQRLNDEIDRSSAAIAKLQRKLKHPNHNGSTTSTPAMNPRTSTSSSVEGLPPKPARDESSHSIERRRNPSTESGGTTGSAHLMSSPEMPQPHLASPLRPSDNRSNDLQKPQGAPIQWDTFNTDQDFGRDSVDWGPVRYSNVFQTPMPPADTTVSKPYSPEQTHSNSNNIPGIGQDVGNYDKNGESDLLAQIEELRSQLKAANDKPSNPQWAQNIDFATPPTRISINSRTSFQARPSQGLSGVASSTQGFTVPTITSPVKSHVDLDPANSHVDLDLATHLRELKALRIKLEQSEELNSRLREQLEKHLKNSGVNEKSSVHLIDQLTAFQNEIKVLRNKVKDSESRSRDADVLAKEVETLRKELSDKLTQIDDQEFEISQLRQQRAALNNVIEERDKILSDLHQSSKEKRTLSTEVSRLQDQLADHSQLNETLQLELSVYDKMMSHTEGSAAAADLPSVSGMDLSLLLEEIRKLRSQLLKTISNNNALRQQLEERLLADLASSGGRPTGVTDFRKGDRSFDSGSLVSNGSEWQQDYMRYSVYDTEKPPRHAAKKIGTDLRCLYAVGKIDDYELLKKEIQESVAFVFRLEDQLKERLSISKRLPNQSGDYETLRSVTGIVENLRYCIKEQERIIKLFWTSQMPSADGTEKVIDPAFQVEYDKLQTQHRILQEEHDRLHKKYNVLKLEMRVVFQRLRGQRMVKEQFEKDFIANLSDIHRLVYGARETLEETKENMT